jgi:hypothetical protein
MKLLLLATFLLASCGKPILDFRTKAPKTPPQLSVFADYEPTSEVVVIEKLNLSRLKFGTQEADLIFPCNGDFGNEGLVNGVDRGQVSIIGDNRSGIIQFGHTRYVEAEDSECRNVSKEGYVYVIDGETLTLTMVTAYGGVNYSTTYRRK